MTTITLSNNFHNSTARVRVPDSGTLSVSQVRRVRRELCGIATCTCGGNLSERGPQENRIVEINPNSDGSVEVRLAK